MLCILVLFAVTVYLVLSVYNASGVGWDFLSRYLNGRTLANGYFYTHLGVLGNKVPLNVDIAGVNRASNVTPALTVGKTIYFDQVWEHLSSAIMALFVIGFGANALSTYLVFLIVLLFAASYVAAEKISVDPLVLTSLMVGPYVVMITIFYNGAEILALGFALLFVGYSVCRRYAAGAYLGLLGLARYDALIVAPLALLVGDRKKVLETIVVAAVVTLPWLVFNLALFGNPLQGYFTDLAEAQPQHLGPVAFLAMVKSIVWYPLILLAIAGAVLAYLNRKEVGKSSRRLSRTLKSVLRGQRARVLLVLLVFSLIGFSFTYNNAQGAIRLGYLVYLSVALIAAVALSMLEGRLVKNARRKEARVIPYMVFIVSLVLLLGVYSGWSAIHFNVLGSLGFRYPAFAGAVAALQSQGLANCSVVSNAWPYLNFYNVTTYSPYLCNATVERMPIVEFGSGVGVSNYCKGSIYNLTNISRQFTYPNFSIYLPTNYICR